MKFAHKILLTLAGLLLCVSMSYGQVTIGASAPPNIGALLDLKTDDVEGANSTLGILMPRVQLESKTKILEAAGDKLEEHVGLMVYNVGPVAECLFSSVRAGLYVWDGLLWEALAGDNANDPGVAANAQVYKDMLGGEIVTDQSITITAGGSVRLVGHADGDGLSYMWYKGGTAPSNEKSIDGGYVLANLQLADQGVYNCRIYDTCGDYVTRSVTVKVVPSGSCTSFGVRDVVMGTKLTPVAPNTYNVNLWKMEKENRNLSLFLTQGTATFEWRVDGVLVPSAIYSSYEIAHSPEEVKTQVVTYTVKQSGCPDQTGVIVLNFMYDCSAQDVEVYAVYDKNVTPVNPLLPFLESDIYHPMVKEVSATGEITYKIRLNEDKIAADRTIYLPIYKNDYFKDNTEIRNVKEYEGVRSVISGMPFAPESGLVLQVPPTGETWTTVENIYDVVTKCSYVATFEVSIGEVCELSQYVSTTLAIEDDFSYIVSNKRLEGWEMFYELNEEETEGVVFLQEMFLKVNVSDMSLVQSITLTDGSFVQHEKLGDGLFKLIIPSILAIDSAEYTLTVTSKDPQCSPFSTSVTIIRYHKNPAGRAGTQ